MDVFVARQPIFDRQDRVVGYELLYRDRLHSDRAPAHVTVDMSTRVIVDAFVGIGLEHLTDGRPAYINCGRDLLLSGTIELLDPKLVVVEVLETVDPDEAVVGACRDLAGRGYRFALDDFVLDERWTPLLEIAEVVKIDVLHRSTEEITGLVDRIRSTDAYLLAEKVETREVLEFCKTVGFDLFQGYVFQRPETVSRKDLTAMEVQVLKLMNLVRDPNISDAVLEEEFGVDIALAYKLLRIVNSATVGGRGIQSIGHAIRLLGRTSIYRWLALLLAASARDRRRLTMELLLTALLRARFCELIGRRMGDHRIGGSLFLVGLFSLLDTILGAPMERILDRLELDVEIRDALIQRTGRFGTVLTLVEAYELGMWNELPRLASSIDLPTQVLGPSYLEALNWAREHLPPLFE